MQIFPKTINVNDNLLNTLNFMNKNRIWDLPVIDEGKRLVGLVHLHLALKKLLKI